MSFEQIIVGHKVTFREEEDYLNCRSQYLQYRKNAVMPEVIFIQYIQNGMYPMGIIVENIETLIHDFVYGESSFAIGNDSGNIHSGSMVTGQFATGQDVHIEGNLVVTGEITSGSTIVGIAGDYNADHFASSYYCEPVPASYSEPHNETVDEGLNNEEIDEFFGINNGVDPLPIPQQQITVGGLPPVEVDLSEPIIGVSKEYLIEESLIGPKKDRWEMLDLRGDDNEHD